MAKQSNFSSIDLLHSIRDIPSSRITSGEKLILTMLLACNNTDNISWRTTENIAELCSMSARGIFPHLRSLSQKGFIFIQHPEHYTHRKSNQYSLNIELLMTYHPTKSPANSASDSPKSPAKFATDLSTETQVAGKIFHQYAKSPAKFSGDRRQNLPTKKEIEEERKEKREPRATSSAPHTLSDFVILEEHKALANRLRMNVDDELDSFKNRHSGRGDLVYEFTNWIKGSHAYRENRRPTKPQEVRSTVQEWGPGHPGWESLHGKRETTPIPIVESHHEPINIRSLMAATKLRAANE